MEQEAAEQDSNSSSDSDDSGSSSSESDDSSDGGRRRARKQRKRDKKAEEKEGGKLDRAKVKKHLEDLEKQVTTKEQVQYFSLDAGKPITSEELEAYRLKR